MLKTVTAEISNKTRQLVPKTFTRPLCVLFQLADNAVMTTGQKDAPNKVPINFAPLLPADKAGPTLTLT